MANICSNELRVANATPETIEKIRNFFDDWSFVDEMKDEISQGEYIVYFDSKWSFPHEKMAELHGLIKDDAGLDTDYPPELTCLSIEWGCTYCAFHIWDKEDGWIRQD